MKEEKRIIYAPCHTLLISEGCFGLVCIQDCLLYDYYSSKHFSMILLDSLLFQHSLEFASIVAFATNLLLYLATHITAFAKQSETRANIKRDEINIGAANSFIFPPGPLKQDLFTEQFRAMLELQWKYLQVERIESEM